MRRTLRILQVEDSLDDAELVLRELRRDGYDLETLRVETAIAMVNALCDKEWDLVLSDYTLPGFGGLEALQVLRTSGADIPFIVVSGAIGEEVAVEAMKAGAHDYVFKGNLARLGSAIERELKEAGIRRQQHAVGNALRASEQRYRDLFEQAPSPINVADYSAVQQIFDEHRRQGVRDFRTFFRDHPEEVRRCAAAVQIVDRNARSLLFFGAASKQPPFWPTLQEELSTLAEGGLSYEGELSCSDTEGAPKVVWLQLSVSPGFEKSLGRVLLSFSDITPRVAMEASLREAWASLERAQAMAHLGSLEWNPAQEQPEWSPELYRIFGLDPCAGAPSHDLFTERVHPEDRLLVLGTLETAIAEGRPLGFEYRICRADGEVRHVHELVEVIPGPVLRMRGTIQDITERKQLEAVLKDLEKLSAKGQMAAYIAHEINNPLAGIKNAFALIEGAISASHPHYKYVELIKREIDRIAGIIRTMYHVYRPQPATTVGDVSLLEAFQDIQSLLVPKCRANGVTIALALPEHGFVVRMNPGLLRQVLFNLVQNALEASPAGSVVTLRAAKAPGEILITVEDQGCGILPEWADRIFEAGFTTKQDSGMSGLGLGLSACRNIVEAMGGSLAFQSNPKGQGVQFQIRLPVARA